MTTATTLTKLSAKQGPMNRRSDESRWDGLASSTMTTYATLLTGCAERHPDKVFLHIDSQDESMLPITYRDIDERSIAISRALLAQGLRPGDRVAIAAPNQIEWLELFFGAARIGIITVTLNIRYRASELRYMLDKSGTRLVVSSARQGDFDFEELYDSLLSEVPSLESTFFLGGTREGSRYADLIASGSSYDGELPQPAPDDPAVILFTSGTTGRPKGATLTHASLIASGTAQNQHVEARHDDVTLGLMPLNHVGGLTCTTTSSLVMGGTVVMLPAFSPASALEALEKYRGTSFGGVPTMWKLMLEHESFPRRDTSALRMAIIGGSNADPALCRQITDAIPGVRLINLYGLSESSGASVMSAADDDVDVVSSSIGVPIPGVEARIANPDPHADGAGELQLRGACVAAGYWEMPEETAATFVDGWLGTGDIGTMDDTGHIRLLGRAKEMYLQGGYNVYPVEIENLLADHPAVSMVAGIGVPDDVLGEVGRYYVVPAPGASVTAQELLVYCKDQVANYKVPREIVFIDEMPLTPSGKIAKVQLRAQYDAG